MKAQAGALLQVVSRFRLRQGDAVQRAESRPQQAFGAPGNLRGGRPLVAMAAMPVPALAAQGGGATAGGDWREF
jgi:hypothetical protein